MKIIRTKKSTFDHLRHYNDIDDKYLKMDMHIHSTWTDGKNSIEEIINQAEILDLKKIAFTDHIRSNSDYFFLYYDKIRKMQKNTDVELLVGFETRIMNFQGQLDVSEEVQNAADLRIASVHRFPFSEKLFAVDEFTLETAQAIECELTLNALERGGFDIIGHAGGMCLSKFGIFSLYYFEAIIALCYKKNIAFEINHKYHCNIYSKLSVLLKKYNPLVTLGSDAHDVSNIATWIKDTTLKGRYGEYN
jgi:putative hydrolase